MISYRSLGEDLVEILLNPPQQFLALRSSSCSMSVLACKFFWDVHSKFLYNDLLRSCVESPSLTIF